MFLSSAAPAGAGLPAVTVPAGQYSSNAPFSLIVVGPQWSEAKLLGLAYSYEQATEYRVVPQLIDPSPSLIAR